MALADAKVLGAQVPRDDAIAEQKQQWKCKIRYADASEVRLTENNAIGLWTFINIAKDENVNVC